MGKFFKLRNYLLNCQKKHLAFSFSEMEQIIRQPLCYSARHYRAYWSPSGHEKGMGGVISDCGNLVEQVDFFKKTVYLKQMDKF